jgi:hypothetical protein
MCVQSGGEKNTTSNNCKIATLRSTCSHIPHIKSPLHMVHNIRVIGICIRLLSSRAFFRQSGSISHSLTHTYIHTHIHTHTHTHTHTHIHTYTHPTRIVTQFCVVDLLSYLLSLWPLLLWITVVRLVPQNCRKFTLMEEMSPVLLIKKSLQGNFTLQHSFFLVLPLMICFYV